MDNQKLIKKALRWQGLMKLAAKRRPAKIGKERFVDTSHGKVKVLEYGFDSPDAAALCLAGRPWTSR
jgi:hypothetical protein